MKIPPPISSPSTRVREGVTNLFSRYF